MKYAINDLIIKECIAIHAIENPEIQLYVSDFGSQKDDYGLVAEVDRRVVGAVWVRIMNDYGHIDNETSSFAISLYKEYRGYGIGTELMKKIKIIAI